MSNRVACVIMLLTFATVLILQLFLARNDEVPGDPNDDGCFCQLKGNVDDCSCSIDTIDYFNNKKIFPRIQSILRKDYFRYFKVNLKRTCPFWSDDSTCSMKDCSVTTCPDEDVPISLKGGAIKHNKYAKEAQSKGHCDENYGGLGAVDLTISDKSKEGFKRWGDHDDQLENFCEMDDETSADSHYVDLLLNPERFTGYKGPSAHRIWRSIYDENCFRPGKAYGPFTSSKNLNAMCLEKRAFYRVISGLHTSINIHVCAQYFIKSINGFQPGSWGLNMEEFHSRFDPSFTEGEGPQRLRNLYFLYLLELRALVKAADYLEGELYYTGSPFEDNEMKQAITGLIDIAKSFPDHFNETVMFTNSNVEAKKLKEDFKLHFRNISKIMDCVGCDKCKLWGKLQIQGLGTALKILFSDNSSITLTQGEIKKNRFQLTRTEIVTFLNAFGKLSTSVHHLESFRKHEKIQRL